MLEYRKAERLCQFEFGILLLLHILYGMALYSKEVVIHIAIYALLFWVPPVILFLFLEKETFVKHYTCISFVLCTYLISLDIGSLIHPLIIFSCSTASIKSSRSVLSPSFYTSSFREEQSLGFSHSRI